jgi:hypothetical protein
MASLTSELIVELLDRVSGPARRVAGSLRGITRTVREVASGTIGLPDRLDAAIRAVFGALGSAILGLLNPLRLVTAAAVALRGALLLTGLGAVLIGIAVAGKFIYDNWQGIGQMFAAFGEAFTAALGPVRPMLDPVISAVSSLFGWLSKLSLEIAPGTWRQWGAAAGTAIGDIVSGSRSSRAGSPRRSGASTNSAAR